MAIKNKTMKLFCLLIIIFFLGEGVKMHAKDIFSTRLNVIDREFYLGDEIKFEVIFENITEETIEIWKPDKCSGVVLDIRSVDGKVSQGISMVPMRVRYNEETGVTEYLIDDNEKIKLQPGESYEYLFTITGYYLDILNKIGSYRFYIETSYRPDDVVSNTVEVNISLKIESLVKIIKLIQNEKVSEEFRANMEEILKQFKPDFRYHSGIPKYLTDIEKARNRDNIEQFLIWWEQNRGSSEVADKIAELNRKAGLEVGE